MNLTLLDLKTAIEAEGVSTRFYSRDGEPRVTLLGADHALTLSTVRHLLKRNGLVRLHTNGQVEEYGLQGHAFFQVDTGPELFIRETSQEEMMFASLKEVQARIKGEDEYAWFVYRGRPVSIPYRNSVSIELKPGQKFGVRWSSNKKDKRLVVEDGGQTRVITLTPEWERHLYTFRGPVTAAAESTALRSGHQELVNFVMKVFPSRVVPAFVPTISGLQSTLTIPEDSAADLNVLHKRLDRAGFRLTPASRRLEGTMRKVVTLSETQRLSAQVWVSRSQSLVKITTTDLSAR